MWLYFDFNFELIVMIKELLKQNLILTLWSTLIVRDFIKQNIENANATASKYFKHELSKGGLSWANTQTWNDPLTNIHE